MALKNFLSWVFFPIFVLATIARGAAIDVQAVLRGKKYNVADVSTVNEIQEKVEQQTGLEASKQAVLFGGQRLKPTDNLESVGIENGSVINIVPRSNTNTKKKSAPAVTTSSVSGLDESKEGKSSASTASSMLQGILNSAGLDASSLSSLMGSMSGLTGSDGQPDMMKSMEMMQQMMSSPIFKEFLSDPEKLEQSRQMLLSNPMMKSMLSSMPGFDDIVNSKEKWRETMVAAANLYENMSPDMLKSVADMAGKGMDLGGMGGGNGNSAFASADVGAFAGLDDLSEGEE